MEKNVGGYDRLARFVVGPVLIVVGAAALAGILTIATGTLGLTLAALGIVVGAILTVTAATQKCPLNNALGFDTYRRTGGETSTEDATAGTRQ